jgi:uncharacterized protein GlcG (DUF336 family)
MWVLLPALTLLVSAVGPIDADPTAAARRAASRARRGERRAARAGPRPQAAPAPPLAVADVSAAVDAAATALGGDGLAIAVCDRAGRPLAVFSRPLATPAAREEALGLARTGALFSNDQAPLSSRTVAYISSHHFPPGIANTAAGALFGIENTNRGCDLNAAFLPGQDLPPATALGGGPGTGPVTRPGGVPLFLLDPATGTRRVAGGIGVSGAGSGQAADAAHEYAAFSALLAGFAPDVPYPGTIYLDGIRLPFVTQKSLPSGFTAGSLAGAYDLGPVAGVPVPDGYLVGPAAGAMLTTAQVDAIVQAAAGRASATRAAIRLPLGSRTRMTIAVSDLDGTILGLFRMEDTTVFSVDVAVAKARNVVWFSSPARPASELPGVPPGTAVTSRTIGFGAQPFFPSGIDGTAPGPFRPLYLFDVSNPCTQGSQPADPNQNGVVFFPGSAPLYVGGVLAGGLGVSGDGVEQDDFVTAGGASGYEPPASLRADQIVISGVRLPYWKFPRNPTE